MRHQNLDRNALFTSGFGKTETGMYGRESEQKVCIKTDDTLFVIGSKSEVKLKVEVDGFNWERCNELYEKTTGIHLIQSQLCAGGKDGKIMFDSFSSINVCFIIICFINIFMRLFLVTPGEDSCQGDR